MGGNKMTKATPSEIRAGVIQVANTGNLPAHTMQAIVENNTGYRDEQSPLPPHRQAGQTKENQLLDTGLRYLEKLREFNGNKVLAVHAFNYGDKRTRQALKDGFSQDETDTVYSTLAREEKYGGEPLTKEKVDMISNVIGKPTKDLGKIAKAPPPKPRIPVSDKPAQQQTRWMSYHNQGAIRNKPLSNRLVNAMSFLNGTGIEMKIFSGGQEGRRRTGSTRHDLGNAADVEFYKDGRKLSFHNKEDRAVLMEITRQASLRGVTGIGAGSGNGDYMGDGRMHLGFGTKATWGAKGKGKNAPSWLRQATTRVDNPYADLGTGVSTGNYQMTDNYYTPAQSVPQYATGMKYEPNYSNPSSYSDEITQSNTDTELATGQEVAQRTRVQDENDYVQIEKTDFREIAKKIFRTKRESILPEYVSKAVKGAIKSV